MSDIDVVIEQIRGTRNRYRARITELRNELDESISHVRRLDDALNVLGDHEPAPDCEPLPLPATPIYIKGDGPAFELDTSDPLALPEVVLDDYVEEYVATVPPLVDGGFDQGPADRFLELVAPLPAPEEMLLEPPPIDVPIRRAEAPGFQVFKRQMITRVTTSQRAALTAECALKAIAAGIDPIDAVAAEFGIKHSSADTYISDARRHGHHIPRRQRADAIDYDTVAAVWHKAHATGGFTTAAVADAFQVSSGIAKNYVTRARERGLIPTVSQLEDAAATAPSTIPTHKEVGEHVTAELAAGGTPLQAITTRWNVSEDRAAKWLAGASERGLIVYPNQWTAAAALAELDGAG